jgi:hypothetical protein
MDNKMSFWTKFLLKFRNPTWREAMMYWSDDEAYQLIMTHDLLSHATKRELNPKLRKVEHPIFYCIYEKKTKVLSLLLDNPKVNLHPIYDGYSFLDLSIKAKLPASICKKLLEKNVECFHPHFMITSIVLDASTFKGIYNESEYQEFVSLLINQYITSYEDSDFPLLSYHSTQQFLRNDLTLLDVCLKYESVDYLKMFLNTQLFRKDRLKSIQYLKEQEEKMKLNKSISTRNKTQLNECIVLAYTQLEKELLENLVNDSELTINKSKKKIKI